MFKNLAIFELNGDMLPSIPYFLEYNYINNHKFEQVTIY